MFVILIQHHIHRELFPKMPADVLVRTFLRHFFRLGKKRQKFLFRIGLFVKLLQIMVDKSDIVFSDLIVDARVVECIVKR